MSTYPTPSSPSDEETDALLALLRRYNQEASIRLQQQHQQQQQLQHQQQQQMMAATAAAAVAVASLPSSSNLGSLLQQQQQQQQQTTTTYFQNNSNSQALNYLNSLQNVPPVLPSPSSYYAGLHQPIQDFHAFYSQMINQHPFTCCCGCGSLCPIHDLLHTPARSHNNSLLGNPLRHQLVLPQASTVVSSSPTAPSLMGSSLSQNVPRLFWQQRQQQQANAVAAAAVAANAAAAATAQASSSTQHHQQQQQQQQHQQQSQQFQQHQQHQQSIRDSNNIRKRQAGCQVGSDGRQKVRRILSMDTTNAPSSSTSQQPALESLITPVPSIMPVRSLPTSYRQCSMCSCRFSYNQPAATVCPCHQSETCPFTGSTCQSCLFNMVFSPSGRINSSHIQAINNRQTHAQRQREAATLFYQQNLYENPAPAGGAGVLVVNNRAPYMDILFFAPGESTVTGISGLPHVPGIPPTGSYTQQAAQQHIQHLHQVLSQNPHITEPPPIGATSDQIKKHTTILSYIKDLSVPEQETERCTVCLMDFETGDEVRSLNCTHLFHTECIDRWLVYNKKCPVCRIEIDNQSNGFTTLCEILERDYIAPPTPAVTATAAL